MRGVNVMTFPDASGGNRHPRGRQVSGTVHVRFFQTRLKDSWALIAWRRATFPQILRGNGWMIEFKVFGSCRKTQKDSLPVPGSLFEPASCTLLHLSVRMSLSILAILFLTIVLRMIRRAPGII